MSNPPLPDVIERAVAWLRSLQFGQPDAYNCANLLEQMAREAASGRANVEAMREAAADVCDKMDTGDLGDYANGFESATRQCADAIRDLPLPGRPAA